ncbi:hypothetical protein [Bradyrhizobium sp. LA2.1]|uniref:hypothetical protein n=1 Tax=Bradyrhizobium sp. LA2.1 TaxID=3156376 RepID=UPI003390A0DD
MSRMSELDMARQTIEAIRPIPLADWEASVRPHLDFIEAGAAMAARHARALSRRPSFESLAEDELRRTRDVLQRALSDITAAQEAYQKAPAEQ